MSEAELLRVKDLQIEVPCPVIKFRSLTWSSACHSCSPHETLGKGVGFSEFRTNLKTNFHTFVDWTCQVSLEILILLFHPTPPTPCVDCVQTGGTIRTGSVWLWHEGRCHALHPTDMVSGAKEPGRAALLSTWLQHVNQYMIWWWLDMIHWSAAKFFVPGKLDAK